MQKITMEDVAEKLNVSKATVSRALNNKSGISRELQEKILNECKEMGYEINHFAQVLSKSEAKIVGVLVTEIFNENGEFFYKEIYTNIVNKLDELGYTTILKIVKAEEIKFCNAPKFVKSQMIDGIIVIGELDKDYIDSISKFNYPIVLVDFDLGGEFYDSIVTNNISSISGITKQLIDEGHEKIIFIGNDKLTNSIHERFVGYKNEMKKANLQVHQLIDRLNFDDESIFDINEIKYFDVFLCNNDYCAFRLIEFIKSNNIDLSSKRVIGFDNTFYSEISIPSISTFEVDRNIIATKSISLLLKRIKNPTKTVANISIKAEYIRKET